MSKTKDAAQTDIDDYGYQGQLAKKATVQKIIGRTAQIDFRAGIMKNGDEWYLIISPTFGREPICHYAYMIEYSDQYMLKGEKDKKKRQTYIADHQKLAATQFYLRCSEWVDNHCTADYPDLPYVYEFDNAPELLEPSLR